MELEKLSPVKFTSVKIKDRFWEQKFKTHREVTIPLCLRKSEDTGRISNFAKAAKLMEGEFEGAFFNDSDVYKIIEGIAASLANNPDTALEQKADGIIDLIASAQEKDGYINTYYSLKGLENRWTDMSMHETYCGGHLIEAAVAYYRATGKATLLGVACRFADHIDSLFGPGKKHWVPGHQEIELALIKLFKQTGEKRYLELARFLIEERGHGHGRGEVWQTEDWGEAYCQDDRPVREISRVTGHAVRAMYYYTGIADIAAETGDREYINALDRVWDHVVNKNMYITGAIGPSNMNEGFTQDYDLPNRTSYCETCASVGMVYWNHRMNLLHKHAKYADIMEMAIYNGALSGVSVNGDRFYYANPLSSDGTRRRKEWFDCSCCPTQIARFIPSIGDYLYCKSKENIWVNIYASNEAELETESYKATLEQETNYPWDGVVNLKIGKLKGSLSVIHLRYPGWCRSVSVNINGADMAFEVENGYIVLSRQWEAGDQITFTMDMPVEIISSHPDVTENKNKVAIRRGPVVYCAEECDNKAEFDEIVITGSTKFSHSYISDLLGGVTIIKALNTDSKEPVILIPYFGIDNREPGKMEVWLKYKAETQALYSTAAIPISG